MDLTHSERLGTESEVAAQSPAKDAQLLIRDCPHRKIFPVRTQNDRCDPVEVLARWRLENGKEQWLKTPRISEQLRLWGQGYFLLEKKKIDPPPARISGHLFVARAFVFGDHGALGREQKELSPRSDEFVARQE